MIKEREYNDIELLQLYKEGGNAHYAFNLIVQKYQERLYWHIRKILLTHDDSKDVVQNTFMKAWQGMQDFREEAQLFTWLYRIATNEALVFIRKRKRMAWLSFSNYADSQISRLKEDSYFEGDKALIEFQKAIQSLPPRQQLVFNMKYFDDLKYEEISDILETSVGSLKASYHHAVKKIEKFILKG